MTEQWTEITTKVHTINDRKYAKGVVMTPAQAEKIEAYIKTEYKKNPDFRKKKITGEGMRKKRTTRKGNG